MPNHKFSLKNFKHSAGFFKSHLKILYKIIIPLKIMIKKYDKLNSSNTPSIIKNKEVIIEILYKDFLGLLKFFLEKIMALDLMPMRKSSSMS